jgi:molybdate transport system substrate-binding protein
VRIEGRFGAVGAMKEALLAGEPCDVMIVTDAMIETLVATGDLDGGSRAALGSVRTGVAVKSNAPPLEVATSEGLRAALLASDRIYFPDPLRATAGIHFADVLRRLGLHDRLRASVRDLSERRGRDARARGVGPTMCRSAAPRSTEILYTDGVRLAGVLPSEFELATGLHRRGGGSPRADRERARRWWRCCRARRRAICDGPAFRTRSRPRSPRTERPPIGPLTAVVCASSSSRDCRHPVRITGDVLGCRFRAATLRRAGRGSGDDRSRPSRAESLKRSKRSVRRVELQHRVGAEVADPDLVALVDVTAYARGCCRQLVRAPRPSSPGRRPTGSAVPLADPDVSAAVAPRRGARPAVAGRRLARSSIRRCAIDAGDVTSPPASTTRHRRSAVAQMP